MNAANWRGRWRIILDRIRDVADAAGEAALLDELSRANSPVVVGFVNAHAMNLLAGDARFFEALNGADILLRDGSGMALLYRCLGWAPGRNMNGTDFIPKLLAAFRGRRVALWGAQDPALAAAAERCRKDFGVELVSVRDGFRPVAGYLDAVAPAPELIVLGMGMPKQEQVAAALRAAGRPAVIVCGGAILDFLGGKVSRAPAWLRAVGCEWLYRLWLEPRRLFRRYILGNPAFLLRAFRFGKAQQSQAGK